MKCRIVWSTDMQTGNRSLDLQHVELIELINTLAYLIETGYTTAQITEALGQLECYVLFHFNFEENLMANNRISPDHALRHIEAHQVFSKTIESFKNDTNLNSKLPRLVAFLVEWLSNHILLTDQELVALCRREGESRYGVSI
jgi:hemerythrin-like metal-binding protein